MDTKDWIAPIVTLAIGASTIFISYKNYQSQTQAKPSELARLELWSKLLSESGIDVGNLPPDDKITAEQREILENYRVFLKRASLESKLRKAVEAQDDGSNSVPRFTANDVIVPLSHDNMPVDVRRECARRLPEVLWLVARGGFLGRA
mgnify:CR=1 FL=1